MSSRSFDAAAALSYDPFAGDETDVRVMSDRIVVAAKPHPRCHICEAEIEKGERHRSRVELNREDDIVMTFRFCNKCCRAMAAVHARWNGYRLIESRERIGNRRREKTRIGEAI